MPRPVHRASVAIGALLLLVPGCCALEDDFRRAIAIDARALVEPISTLGSSGDAHIGVQVRLPALTRWLNRPEHLKALPRFEQAIGLGRLGVPLAIRASARFTRVEIAAAKWCDPCVAVVAQVELCLVLDAPPLVGEALSWPREGFRLQGQLGFDAGLRWEGGGRTPAVWLDGSQIAVAGFDLALDLLPDEIEDGVRRVVLPLSSAIATAILSDFRLLEVPPIALGPTRVQVAVADLRTDPGTNRLYLGLITNLAVSGAAAIRPWLASPASADVEIRLSARLPELTVRELLEEGFVPRRYDGSIQPDPAGELHVTLEAVHLSPGRIEAPFGLWRLRFPCFVAELSVRGRIATNPAGRFVVILEEIALLAASAFEPQLRKALWKQSRLARTVAEVTERYLNGQFVRLPFAASFTWAPSAYRLTPELIAVDGTLK